MSWRDDLREASFRGVQFFVERTQDPLGRRQAVHEYPLRDKPFVEDLGRFGGDIRIAGYLVGTDYHLDRDKFVEALNKPGPGTLVHPYLGELNVSVLPGSQTHSLVESGMVRFDLVFVEGEAAKNPAARVDTAGKVSNLADLSFNESYLDLDAGLGGLEFNESFVDSIAGSWVADAATGLLGDITGEIDSIVSEIPIDDVLGSVSAITGITSGIRSTAESLIRAPASLAGQMIGAVSGMSRLFVTPFSGFSAYTTLFDAVGRITDTFSTSTSSGLRAQDNNRALKQFTREVTLFEAARQISGGLPFEAGTGDLSIPLSDDAPPVEALVFESRDQALAAQAELLNRIDEIAPGAGDNIFPKLIELRAAVATDIKIRAATLPRISEYTPRRVRPTLAIAWDLYQDAEHAADLASRNRLPHPGFVQGGDPIEVLSRA